MALRRVAVLQPLSAILSSRITVETSRFLLETRGADTSSRTRSRSERIGTVPSWAASVTSGSECRAEQGTGHRGPAGVRFSKYDGGVSAKVVAHSSIQQEDAGRNDTLPPTRRLGASVTN